jgi:hypothetical protein
MIKMIHIELEQSIDKLDKIQKSIDNVETDNVEIDKKELDQLTYKLTRCQNILRLLYTDEYLDVFYTTCIILVKEEIEFIKEELESYIVNKEK